jgi:hypothetical protein
MFGGHGHSHGGGGGGGNGHQMTPEEMQAHMQRVQSFMRNMQMANPNMPQFNNMMGPPTPQMMQAAQEFMRKQMQMAAANGNDFQVPPIPLGFQSNTSNTQTDKEGSGVICKQDTSNAPNGPEDFSKADIVKATQYGAFDRCKELIEAGYNVNQPDKENVYLLHWAAINNHCHVAKYYIDKGAIVDAIGGELESTPLHWAARHGHLKMVVLLIAHGANPLLFDNEGFAVVHLATMYGHSPVVAYLLAKGIDVR